MIIPGRTLTFSSHDTLQAPSWSPRLYVPTWIPAGAQRYRGHVLPQVAIQRKVLSLHWSRSELFWCRRNSGIVDLSFWTSSHPSPCKILPQLKPLGFLVLRVEESQRSTPPPILSSTLVRQGGFSGSASVYLPCSYRPSGTDHFLILRSRHKLPNLHALHEPNFFDSRLPPSRSRTSPEMSSTNTSHGFASTGSSHTGCSLLDSCMFMRCISRVSSTT